MEGLEPPRPCQLRIPRGKDRLLAKGRTHSTIAEAILEDVLSATSVARHFKSCYP